jgi:hypothetical protein
MGTYEISSTVVYVLAFIGITAIFSGIWGILQRTRATPKTDLLNCLQYSPSASPSCADAKTHIVTSWTDTINKNVGYSVSILLHGIILSGLTYYIYKSKMRKE